MRVTSEEILATLYERTPLPQGEMFRINKYLRLNIKEGYRTQLTVTIRCLQLEIGCWSSMHVNQRSLLSICVIYLNRLDFLAAYDIVEYVNI